jgi:hypothetical protein
VRRLGLGRAKPERGSELGSLEPISDDGTSTGLMMGSRQETKETKETIDEVSLVACKSECAIEVCKEMRGDPLVFSVLQFSSAAGDPEQAYSLG